MRMVTKLHLGTGHRPAGSLSPVSTSLRTPPMVTGLGRPDPQTRPPAALPILVVWALALGLCLAFWAGVAALLVSLI